MVDVSGAYKMPKVVWRFATFLKTNVIYLIDRYNLTVTRLEMLCDLSRSAMKRSEYSSMSSD